MKNNKYWKSIFGIAFLIFGFMSFAQDDSAPNPCECTWSGTIECDGNHPIDDRGETGPDLVLCSGEDLPTGLEPNKYPVYGAADGVEAVESYASYFRLITFLARN